MIVRDGMKKLGIKRVKWRLIKRDEVRSSHVQSQIWENGLETNDSSSIVEGSSSSKESGELELMQRTLRVDYRLLFSKVHISE